MRTPLSMLFLITTLCACATNPASPIVGVPALRETPPVGVVGDAADDPAIWAAPDAARSRVIGTQKQGGLFVYDMTGAVVQEIALGRPNNIDLRDGYAWPEGLAPILAASDRADNSLTLWRLNPQTGLLDPTPRARIATAFTEVYGVCLGRVGADFIALATSHDGDVKVWRILPNGEATLLGGFALGSISEGCVIDDERGIAYVAQETVGIWRFSLAAPDGADKQLIDRVGDGRLFADVEGLALWHGPRSTYLVASAQGRSRFAVYDVVRAHAYRGAFTIDAGPGGDAVSGTDGVEVSSAAFGDVYPRGLIVAQDDRNTAPTATQNFKYASWANVMSALGLD